MECPNCNAELEEEVAVCPSCGAATEHEATVTFVPVSPTAHPALSPDQAAHVPGVVGYALVVERGPRAGMTWMVREGTTTVGRHPDSDIFLDDITVSRHHCRFRSEGQVFSIEDSGSTNGTYVNGERVDRGALQPGDEVIIGKFHLIVALGDD
ncbi:MAG: FHA domain-containing protein [Acidimicrobiia bacterium]